MAIESPSPWAPRADPNADERTVDIREYFRMFRRRWWIAILALVICVGGAVGLTRTQTKIYQACTRLFVGQQAISRADIQFAAGLTQTSLALVRSYSEAIKSLPIAQEVVTKEGLLDDPRRLLGGLSAAPIADTQLIRICYRNPSPQKAQQVTDSFAASFVTAIQKIDRLGTGEPAVQVSVLEPAPLPSAPASPRPVRNGAAGLILGAAFAWGLVLLAERLDSTIKGRTDAEELAGMPVLSLVPTMQHKRRSFALAAGTPAAESYRLLRTAIRFMGADDPVKTLVVTSAESGDGKTTTALNLAAAFAESGLVTLLVEADMRKPSIAAHVRVSPKGGLAAYLSGATDIKGLVHKTSRPNFYVIPAGSTPLNPSELLGSERMAKLLRTLAKEAAIIIIDTPPVMAVSDALALTPMVDAEVLVVRAGKTRKENIRESLRVLSGVGAPVLGLILNGMSGSEGYYGYGYYGYGRKGVAIQADPGLSEVETGNYIPAPAEQLKANGQKPAAKARKPTS